MSAGDKGSGAALEPVLGRFDVTMFVMGSIVGAGIFNRPSEIASAMGSTTGVLSLWALGGVFAFTGAIVFAELGGMLPHAGGQYVFVREAYGRFAAFLFGWVLLTGISSSALAFVAGVFADHVAVLAGKLGLASELDARARQVIAIALIALVTLLNARGVRLAAAVQNVSMLAKIVGISAIIALGAFVGLGWLDSRVAASAAATPLRAWTWGGAGGALLSVAFTYGGWQNVTAAASEVKQPERTLPQGILLGTLGVIALYLGFNGALIEILGLSGVAATSTPTVDAANAVLPGGGVFVAVLVVISTFAFVQGLCVLAPRIYYAMARDGVFFAAAARVHPRWKTPALAIALQGLVAILHVALAGAQLGALVDVCILCDSVFFTSCGVALFVLRRKQPDAPRPYRALGYPWLPALFVLVCAGNVAQGIANAKPGAALAGALVFAVGIALYWFWRRKGAVTSA
jgi:APA family basic amino acid/polyamine antiporter